MGKSYDAKKLIVSAVTGAAETMQRRVLRVTVPPRRHLSSPSVSFILSKAMLFASP